MSAAKVSLRTPEEVLAFVSFVAFCVVCVCVLIIYKNCYEANTNTATTTNQANITDERIEAGHLVTNQA